MKKSKKLQQNDLDHKDMREAKSKRRLGILKGKIKISKDFDAPLPDDFLAEFEK